MRHKISALVVVHQNNPLPKEVLMQNRCLKGFKPGAPTPGQSQRWVLHPSLHWAACLSPAWWHEAAGSDRWVLRNSALHTHWLSISTSAKKVNFPAGLAAPSWDLNLQVLIKSNTTALTLPHKLKAWADTRCTEDIIPKCFLQLSSAEFHSTETQKGVCRSSQKPNEKSTTGVSQFQSFVSSDACQKRWQMYPGVREGSLQPLCSWMSTSALPGTRQGDLCRATSHSRHRESTQGLKWKGNNFKRCQCLTTAVLMKKEELQLQTRSSWMFRGTPWSWKIPSQTQNWGNTVPVLQYSHMYTWTARSSLLTASEGLVYRLQRICLQATKSLLEQWGDLLEMPKNCP